MAAQRLDPGDREFFSLVSRAAFVNPFSHERDLLDARIAQTEGNDPDLVPRLLARLETRLLSLEERGDLAPELYAPDEWALIELAVLFESFHRFADRLDALIEAQLAAGETPVPVSFAEELLSRLAQRGSSAERSRIFSLFWQMRRAYYFIAGGLVGVSRSVRRLREALWNDVFTHDFARYERLLWDRLEDFSLILKGETGSGKGQAAAAIGRSGYVPFDSRKNAFAVSFTELFVPINLSQFPERRSDMRMHGRPNLYHWRLSR